jgi:hypothetical protein
MCYLLPRPAMSSLPIIFLLQLEGEDFDRWKTLPSLRLTKRGIKIILEYSVPAGSMADSMVKTVLMRLEKLNH